VFSFCLTFVYQYFNPFLPELTILRMSLGLIRYGHGRRQRDFHSASQRGSLLKTVFFHSGLKNLESKVGE